MHFLKPLLSIHQSLRSKSLECNRVEYTEPPKGDFTGLLDHFDSRLLCRPLARLFSKRRIWLDDRVASELKLLHLFRQIPISESRLKHIAKRSQRIEKSFLISFL